VYEGDLIALYTIIPKGTAHSFLPKLQKLKELFEEITL